MGQCRFNLLFSVLTAMSTTVRPPACSISTHAWGLQGAPTRDKHCPGTAPPTSAYLLHVHHKIQEEVTVESLTLLINNYSLI